MTFGTSIDYNDDNKNDVVATDTVVADGVGNGGDQSSRT
jgi:hypothetical protein